MPRRLIARLCALLVVTGRLGPAPLLVEAQEETERNPTSLDVWLDCPQTCQTTDGLYGACKQAHLCEKSHLRLSSYVENCDRGEGQRLLCCPWPQQETLSSQNLVQCGRLCRTEAGARGLYGTCQYGDDCPDHRRRLVTSINYCTSSGFTGRVCCPFNPRAVADLIRLNISDPKSPRSIKPIPFRIEPRIATKALHSSKPITKPTTKPTISNAPNPNKGTNHAAKTMVPTTPKPIIKPTSKPTVKTTTKITVTPTIQRTQKPTAKPNPKPIKNPTPKPITKSTVKPTTKPTAQITAPPIIQTTPKPIAEPKPRLTNAATPKPIIKTSVEPTTKPTTKITVPPIIKKTPKPAVKTTKKPFMKSGPTVTTISTTKPNINTTAKPADKPTTKPTTKAAVKPTENPHAEIIDQHTGIEEELWLKPFNNPGKPQKIIRCGEPQPERLPTEASKRRWQELSGGGVARTIFGGTPADPRHWPWMVFLEVWNVDILRYNPHCGGTLIDHQHVLTAAHCIDYLTEMTDRIAARFGRRISREQFIKVSLGMYYRIQDKPMYAGVDKIILHPRYRIGELHHDIAILRLHAPVRYSSRIQPICLPDRATGDLQNKTVTVAGWGLTAENSDKWSDSLLSVNLQCIDVRDCEKKYANVLKASVEFRGGFGDTKLCTTDPQPDGKIIKDACNGDSGGPMVFVNHDHRRFLVGIVSGGNKCGRKEYPGIYTRVSSYLDWIRSVTNPPRRSPFTKDGERIFRVLKRPVPDCKTPLFNISMIHLLIPGFNSKVKHLLPPPIVTSEPWSPLDV